jgi:TPR repeat protein
MKRLALALFLVFMDAGSVVAELDEAIAAYEHGDYETAFRELVPLAEQGDFEAQFRLGLMYGRGEGVQRDFSKAAGLIGLAAEQGHVYAQFALGSMYHVGRGVPRDYAKTAEWWRLSAEQDLQQGQYHLGHLYRDGRGVPQGRTSCWPTCGLISPPHIGRLAKTTIMPFIFATRLYGK